MADTASRPGWTFDHLGTDLAVLHVESASDATQADVRVRTRNAPLVEAKGSVSGRARVGDLAPHTGRENLAQAIALRLLTPVGSLAALGHPTYGSRLQDLLGRRKDESNRLLCRAFVLEALAAEPRIDPGATVVEFDRERETIDAFMVAIDVRPVTGGDRISLGLEVAL
jgi:phage baseplate assembly protein W